MENFIVYNKYTGDILRTGCCPMSMVSIQASELNEIVIIGEANDSKERIANGKVVSKSQEELNILKEMLKPDPTEQLIRREMDKFLREMTITKLKKEGKIE